MFGFAIDESGQVWLERAYWLGEKVVREDLPPMSPEFFYGLDEEAGVELEDEALVGVGV